MEKKYREKILNVKFEVNKHFLLAELLMSSYKLDKMCENSQEYQEFRKIAESLPAVHSLFKFGEIYDSKPEGEQGKYNHEVGIRLDKIAKTKNDEEFINIEDNELLESFRILENTAFFQDAFLKSEEHKKDVETQVNEVLPIAEEKLTPFLKNDPKRTMRVSIITPKYFDGPYSIPDQSGKREDVEVAMFPDYYEQSGKNTRVVAIIHEIMHAYIEFAPKEEFESKLERDIYGTVNHSLVELLSNCELGVALRGDNNYFEMAMHNETIPLDGSMKREDFIRLGIDFPDELLFESRTVNYGREKVVSRDGLGIDKVRGLVYPYFLVYKYKENENPIYAVTQDMKRDKEKLIEIYGEEFFYLISDSEYLQDVIEITKNQNSLVELNDLISKEIFGIERKKTLTLENVVSSTNAQGLKAIKKTNSELRQDITRENKTFVNIDRTEI